MAYYVSVAAYIGTACDLNQKIARMEQVIEALEMQAINAAANSDLQSYSLEDGQVTIKTEYRSPQAIAQAIQAFETLKQTWLNRLVGRVSKGVDSQNMRYNLYNGC